MFQQISKNNYTDHTLNNYIFKFENKITKNSTRLLKTKKKNTTIHRSKNHNEKQKKNI